MAFKRSSNSAGGLQATFDSGTPAQKAAFQASVSGGIPYVYNGTTRKLKKFAAAKAKTLAGISDTRILVIGDSSVEGTGSSLAASYPERNAWPARAAAYMTAAGIPAAPGLAAPAATTPAAPQTNPDARWTLGTGWAATQGYGFMGACAIRGTTPSGSLVFADPSVVCDAYDIYYCTLSGHGIVTATATGGSATPINTSAATGIGKTRVFAAAASASNTLTMTGTLSTLVVGVEPVLTARRQVLFANVGAGGASSVHWSSAQATNLGTQRMINAYAPDLVIIKIAQNDMVSSRTPAQYLTNMNTIIGWCTAAGADVMLMTYSPFARAVLLPYESGIYSALMSFAENYCVADQRSRAGTYAEYSALGMMEGDLHPNDAGYSDEGGFIGRLLLSV